MVQNTTYKRAQIAKEFLEGRTARSYANGRMFIRESPDGGGTQLVAYGSQIIAELEGGQLKFHTGHYGQVSKTVTEYVSVFGSVLSKGGYSELSVSVQDTAPTTGHRYLSIMAQSAQYIDRYVRDFTREFSDVEQDAREDVEAALRRILEIEFGDE